jgi:small subunit ribosomal protein S6
MNDYEILLMLDPETPEERHDEIIARARELVEKGGGKWLSHDPWGRRRLAYEIDHKTDGVYHLLQFDAEPATLDEVARVLKISDTVMRHMATRRPKGGGRTAPPPPLPPIEAEPVVPAYRPEPPAEAPLADEVQDDSVGARPQPGSDSASPEAEVGPTEEYPAPTESEPESERGA